MRIFCFLLVVSGNVFGCKHAFEKALKSAVAAGKYSILDHDENGVVSLNQPLHASCVHAANMHMTCTTKAGVDRGETRREDNTRGIG